MDDGPSRKSMSDTLRTNWRSLLYAGILIGIIGLIAIFVPYVTGLSITLLLGALLVVGGIFHFIGAFRVQGWGGFLWQLVLGVIAVIAGGAILLNPTFGLVTLTLLVIAYFLVSGVVEIIMGLTLRSERGWFWSVVSGVIGILLAVLLWAGFPSTAAWAVGLLFGINLLVTGASMVAIALSARSVERSMDRDRVAGAGGV
jgi:uncharacterized membrane protein HdeD (DUF308 family)